MAIDLAGKPICITGASSGIGLATAIACSHAGMPVVLAARRPEQLEAALAATRAAGSPAIAAPADARDPHACAAMIDRCIAEFGSIHSIFANAGYGLESPVHKTTDSAMRDIFETNFFGTLNTIRPAIPHMLAQRSGHILICASSIGRLATPRHGAYCATKAAQVMVGRAMSLELRAAGIRTSVIMPVVTRTAFFDTAATHSPAGSKYASGSRGTSRFAQPPERVARAIIACLRRPRPEVWTSTPVRFAAALATAFPSLADRALARYARPDADEPRR